jgi:hypothetical protein
VPRASRLAQWQHGLEQLSSPLLLLEIVQTEAGSELPVGRRNGARVSLRDDGGRPARARTELGLLVRAILAQVERPGVRASPLDRAVEVDRDVLLGADRAGPIDTQLILLFRPFGALVGEIEWVVVVDGDDQVRVGCGQLERWEAPEGVPLRASDDDRALRIRRADHGQQLGDEGVVLVRGELVVRLVQELEVERVRIALIALGDLPPDAAQASLVRVGLDGHLVVMVNIDNRPQTSGERRVDGPLDAGSELGVDRKWGNARRVRAPAHGDADMLEPDLGDEREIFVSQRDAPLPFLRGIERIAEVDAPAQAARLIEGGALGGLQVFVSCQRRGHHPRLRLTRAGDRREHDADACQ